MIRIQRAILAGSIRLRMGVGVAVAVVVVTVRVTVSRVRVRMAVGVRDEGCRPFDAVAVVMWMGGEVQSDEQSLGEEREGREDRGRSRDSVLQAFAQRPRHCGWRSGIRLGARRGPALAHRERNPGRSARSTGRAGA